MPTTSSASRLVRTFAVAVGVAAAICIFAAQAEAALTFLGVAAGDATTTKITLWTRAMDPAAPGNALLSVDLAADPAFSTGLTHVPAACTTDSTKDFTCKADLANLQPGTVYFYRFCLLYTSPSPRD